MKYDLGFGNSVCVRQAFLNTYHGELVVFSHHGLRKFDYPERTGDPELIELTRKVIKRQTGKDYKHILITNGATGGVVIALRSFAQKHFQFCVTRKAPWYLRYPSMISAAGLIHDPEYGGVSQVTLLDFPSNPLGLVTDIKKPNEHTRVILDGVYHGQVYSKLLLPLPEHEVYVGSYSKLLGLNGLRVGWIATDWDYMYDQMLDLVIGEYCGISVASTEIIKSVLANFDWDSFEGVAQLMLDDNREEFSKLERYFGTKVPEIGMFYYGNTDAKLKSLMRKAGIGWTSGELLGTTDDFGRLNMGQDRDVVWNAVNDLIKSDKI